MTMTTNSTMNMHLLLVLVLTILWGRTTHCFAPNGRIHATPRSQHDIRITKFARSSWLASAVPKEAEIKEEEDANTTMDTNIDIDDVIVPAAKEAGKEIADISVTTTTTTNRFQRLRKKYFGKKPDDGLTFKQRLGKAGLSVALSYGWVSNVSVAISVSLSWYIFNRRTGLSPLAPGQWKGFLAVYAGIYVFNNIIRPLRFALSVGVSTYFDRAIQKIQSVLKVNKGVAIFLTVFFANIVGTCTLIALGVSLASFASGVPIFVPKP